LRCGAFEAGQEYVARLTVCRYYTSVAEIISQMEFSRRLLHMDETVRPENSLKEKCTYDPRCTAQTTVREISDVTHVPFVAIVSSEGETHLPLILRAFHIQSNTQVLKDLRHAFAQRGIVKLSICAGFHPYCRDARERLKDPNLRIWLIMDNQCTRRNEKLSHRFEKESLAII
jgi:hypothetical protein